MHQFLHTYAMIIWINLLANGYVVEPNITFTVYLYSES